MRLTSPESLKALKAVKRLRFRWQRLAAQYLSGAYSSKYRGQGMIFSDYRVYEHGDDAKHMAWSVMARTGEPHVKSFEEERSLQVILAVDLSDSVFFGSSMRTKRDALIDVAAILAFVAEANQDNLGLMIFSDKVEMFLPPRRGLKQVNLVLYELLKMQPAKRKTSFEEPFQNLVRLLKRRAQIFVLSDFLSENWDVSLKLVGTNHSMKLIQILDPWEVTPPDLGAVRLDSPEFSTVLLPDSWSKDSIEAEKIARSIRILSSDDPFLQLKGILR